MGDTTLDPDNLLTQTPVSLQESEICDLSDDEFERLLEERRRELGITDRSTVSGPQLHSVVTQVSVATPEQLAERGKREDQARRMQLLAKRQLAWQRFIANRGIRYADCRGSNFEKATEDQVKVVELLKAYSVSLANDQHDSTGLLLYGPKGTGKDHLVVACARAAIACDLSIEWINGLDLYALFRDAMDSKESEAAIVSRFYRPDILYLSDPLPPIGKLTEFQAGAFFRILDRRYSQKKRTWITVNVSGSAELDERLGAQNGDRLRHDAIAVFCNWQSYRKTKSL